MHDREAIATEIRHACRDVEAADQCLAVLGEQVSEVLERQEAEASQL